MSQSINKPIAYRMDKARTEELQNEIASAFTPEKIVACGKCDIKYGLLIPQGTSDADQEKYVSWLRDTLQKDCPDHHDRVRP